ncbi:MAG TPA: potassium channel family protein [Lacipirellulaceae bacterium]|nr:potassium channel family protein [Lacipirellulaceae bacterium]
MRQFLIFLRKWRYLFLLGTLFALLVIEPIASSFGVMKLLFDALLVFVMAVLVFALAKERVWRVVSLLLCAPAAILSIGSHFLTATAHDTTLLAGHAMSALFFVIVTGKIVQSIFATHELSWDSVFGAICGFLLLGVAWGLTYATIYVANAESFHFGTAIRPNLDRGEHSRHVFIYYSFVTLTTAGFGDVTPVSLPARTLSWVEAVTGQLYLVVLITGLIGALVARTTDPAGDRETENK